MIVSGTPRSAGGKARHRLPGDLREAVVAQVDPGGIVLSERARTLIGVGRAGGAVHKTSDAGARSDEATRGLGVHLETALPVGASFGSDERRGVEHVRQAIGQPGWIERRHVAHQGHDAGLGQTLDIAGSTTSGQPEDLMALGQGSRDGKSDTSRRSGDQYLPPFAGRFDVFFCHEGQLRSIRLPQRGSGAQSSRTAARLSRGGDRAHAESERARSRARQSRTSTRRWSQRRECAARHRRRRSHPGWGSPYRGGTARIP